MLTKQDLDHIDNLLTIRIKKELKHVKDDIAHIRNDMKTIVNFFDREYLELRKRVEKIEEILKINPSN